MFFAIELSSLFNLYEVKAILELTNHGVKIAFFLFKFRKNLWHSQEMYSEIQVEHQLKADMTVPTTTIKLFSK